MFSSSPFHWHEDEVILKVNYASVNY